MISAESCGRGSIGSCFSLSLILVLLIAEKKRAKFKVKVFKNVFPMFSGSQSTRLLSVYAFQSAALTIWNKLPAMPLHPLAGPVLSPAKPLPHLIEHLWNEHSGISISADP